MEKRLADYLTSSFWRFNVDFCIQFVAVDYAKLALIGGGDVDDAFDMTLTDKTISDHISDLNRLHEISDQEMRQSPGGQKLLDMQTEFFSIYNMIIKRLILLSHRIDYTGSPAAHKTISNMEQFKKVYCDSVVKLSQAHLTTLTEFINDVDRKEAASKKKGKKGDVKTKVFNFSELALDKLSRDKENGN